ncbi:MAG TPA: MFS transporter [Rhizomicrobium sp.]
MKSSNDVSDARRLAVDEAATAGEPTDPASAAGLAATGLAAWLHRPAGTSATGGPIASRLGQISWALFEGARIPYVLLVTIYLYAPYFAKQVVGDPVRGQELWAAFSSYGGFATAVAAPFLGAVADIGGRRKPWIALYTVMMVAAMFLMGGAVPHAPWSSIVFTGLLIAAANFAYEFSTVFHSAMLPTIAPHERVGPLSGLGLSLGNVAGIVLLVVVMVGLALPGQVDWPFVPAHPLFGVQEASHGAERLSGPICAVWLAVLSLPLFLFTPDKPSTGVPIVLQMKRGVGAVWHTIRSLAHYRNVAMYLLARVFFNDGMSAVLLFSGIFAAVTFNWGALTMTVVGVELSVFAIVGGFFGGFLDNRLGSKRALFVSVGGTLACFAAALTMAPDRILWLIPYDTHAPPINALPFFNTWPEVIYMAISNGVAVFITAGYANARTMMARLAPAEKMTEFFGLMSLSGTSTTFLANVSVTVMTALTMSQRGGLVAILGFLATGLILLIFVKEERAVAV